MKGVLFLASHLGAGSDALFNILTAHPRIEGFKTHVSYDHYDKIESLLSHPHKYNKSNAIWMDMLMYNHSITCKPLIDRCKFVFFLGEPRSSLVGIMSETGYSLDQASRYYQYRLHGLCEYAIRSGGRVVTSDRLSDLSEVERYLGVKDGSLSETQSSISLEPAVSLDSETLDLCERCYEQHLGHLVRTGLV